MKRVLLYIFLIWSLPSGIQAVDLTKVNFNYLYDDSFSIDHQMTLKEGILTIFLSLQSTPEKVNFLYQNNYQDENHVEVTPVNSQTTSSSNSFIFQASVSNVLSFNLLVLKITSAGKIYYYDIPINKGIELAPPDFVIFNSQDSTVFTNDYFSKGQKLRLEKDSLIGYAYQQNFTPAIPPMIIRAPSGNKKLLLDSVFNVPKEFEIDSTNQLFFIQTDSSSKIGRGFITVPEYFPKSRSHEELVQPLIYISTKEEYQKINNAKNKKKAFDNFWIGRLKNKDRAKLAVKKFYQNVSKANDYFTNYKEGWKTDPGMVYIVFGTPDEITRSEDEEKWSYLRFGEKVTFAFKKIPNLFVRQHLRLQRDKAHSKIWFREVSTWRKGSL